MVSWQTRNRLSVGHHERVGVRVVVGLFSAVTTVVLVVVFVVVDGAEALVRLLLRTLLLLSREVLLWYLWDVRLGTRIVKVLLIE